MRYNTGVEMLILRAIASKFFSIWTLGLLAPKRMMRPAPGAPPVFTPASLTVGAASLAGGPATELAAG